MQATAQIKRSPPPPCRRRCARGLSSGLDAGAGAGARTDGAAACPSISTGQSDIGLPGTDIPVNRLGIEDAELLHAVEAELLDQASQLFLDELTPDTRFDEGYAAACTGAHSSRSIPGQVNTAPRTCPRGARCPCRGQYVPDESQRIFKALEDEDFLRREGWPAEQFAERLAYYQGELIALHPFYELNGRITRLCSSTSSRSPTGIPRWITAAHWMPMKKATTLHSGIHRLCTECRRSPVGTLGIGRFESPRYGLRGVPIGGKRCLVPVCRAQGEVGSNHCGLHAALGLLQGHLQTKQGMVSIPSLKPRRLVRNARLPNTKPPIGSAIDVEVAGLLLVRLDQVIATVRRTREIGGQQVALPSASSTIGKLPGTS